jgi:hypothetical protein
MRCISKIEEPEPSSQLQLFASLSSEVPIGGGYISILADDCPGSTPEDPVAVVEEPPRFPAYPDFTQPLLVTRSYSQFLDYNETLMLMYFSDPGGSDGWLVVTAGAMLYTNNEGVKSRSFETYNPTTRQTSFSNYLSLEAVNSDGELGCEYTSCFPSINSYIFFISLLR